VPTHVPPASQQQFGADAPPPPPIGGQYTPPPAGGQYTPPPPPTIGGPAYGGGGPAYGGGGPAYGGPGGPVPGQKIPNYLVFSIILTICCCPWGSPFGIVSIIFGAQVNSKLAAGDVAGAMNSSKNARLWLIIGLVVGLLVSVVLFMTTGFEQFMQGVREGMANR
jgi:hypothetical protein